MELSEVNPEPYTITLTQSAAEVSHTTVSRKCTIGTALLSMEQSAPVYEPVQLQTPTNDRNIFCQEQYNTAVI